jgi:hypothetical protein
MHAGRRRSPNTEGYHELWKRLVTKSIAEGPRMQWCVAELTRAIDRLADGITKGIGDPNDLGARMKPLSIKPRELLARLAGMPPKQCATWCRA